MTETARILKLWGPAVAAIKADPVYQTSDSQGLAQVYDALLALEEATRYYAIEGKPNTPQGKWHVTERIYRRRDMAEDKCAEWNRPTVFINGDEVQPYVYRVRTVFVEVLAASEPPGPARPSLGEEGTP